MEFVWRTGADAQAFIIHSLCQRDNISAGRVELPGVDHIGLGL
jgi:hypothetical protein